MSYRWLLVIPIAVLAIAGGVLINEKLGHSPSNSISSLIDIDNDDLNVDWSKYPSYDVELSETLYIHKSGTYNLTGSLSDGSININATGGFVRLVLNNISIENTSGPAISCTEAEELLIVLEGVNYLKDGSSYSSKYDEDVNGVIYSKADLSFYGTGMLNITSNFQDGIVSKDDLTIREGIYNIYTVDDGIRGKDSVRIAGGSIFINSGADGIKSTNDTDNGKGYVYIENGSVSVNSGDDGIHATKYLIVDNGYIKIEKSQEGIEAPIITINNGIISVNSSDDGINAGTGVATSNTPRPGGMMDADENCILTINGGDVYVNAGGDGIDSNGYVYINGGYLVVDGPTSSGNGALDAGLGFVVKGGEALALGSSGMAENFGSKSTVNSISYFLSNTYPSGSIVTIVDSDDKPIFEHTSVKKFSHIAAVSSSFNIGEQYKIYIDDELIDEVLITSTVTSNRASTGPNGSMQRR